MMSQNKDQPAPFLQYHSTGLQHDALLGGAEVLWAIPLLHSRPQHSRYSHLKFKDATMLWEFETRYDFSQSTPTYGPCLQTMHHPISSSS